MACLSDLDAVILVESLQSINLLVEVNCQLLCKGFNEAFQLGGVEILRLAIFRVSLEVLEAR